MNSVDLYGELFVNTENLPKIKWDSPNLFNQIGLDLLKSKDSCKVKITLEVIKEKKTVQQLRYFKGVMIKYIKNWMVEQGNNVTDWEVDMFLRSLFFYETLNGEKIIKDLSIATKEEVSDFISKIEVWRNELEIYIPLNDSL